MMEKNKGIPGSPSKKEPIQVRSGIGLAVGLSLGTLVGIVIDNIGLGMMMGVAVGLCVGSTIDVLRKNKKTTDQKDDNEKY